MQEEEQKPNKENEADEEHRIVPVSTVKLAFVEGLRKSAEETALTHRQFAESVMGKYDAQFKAIQSMVNSSGFQYMLENVRRTQEAVQKMAETILPVIKDVEKNISFAESIFHREERIIPVYHPQTERVIVKERVVEKVVVIREEGSSITKEDILAIIKTTSEKTAEIMIKEIRKEQKKQDGTQLFLTLAGDLYREPKDKYCYSMKEAKSRFGIVELLAKANGKSDQYTPTEDIRDYIGSSSNPAVRDSIGEINDTALTTLKLKEKLIEGKTGSGYRINPLYKIEALDTF